MIYLNIFIFGRHGKQWNIFECWQGVNIVRGVSGEQITGRGWMKGSRLAVEVHLRVAGWKESGSITARVRRVNDNSARLSLSGHPSPFVRCSIVS